MSDQVKIPGTAGLELPTLELNVGGVFYSTSTETLQREPGGALAKMLGESGRPKAVRDAKGRYFIDRDGVLFRYILDYLRNLKLVLPENFHEKERLRQEAEFYNLPKLAKMIPALQSFNPANNVTTGASKVSINKTADCTSKDQIANVSTSTNTSRSLSPNSCYYNSSRPSSPNGERPMGYITVGYRGTFAFGRDGLADVKFRKLSRIIVSGRVSLCREVFKDTLNESRDPDRGDCDRYTSRFFLKHSFLEQAFDMLQEEGFELTASCGSGTNSAGEIKPGMDSEEAKWQHYNEFIFQRPAGLVKN